MVVPIGKSNPNVRVKIASFPSAVPDEPAEIMRTGSEPSEEQEADCPGVGGAPEFRAWGGEVEKAYSPVAQVLREPPCSGTALPDRSAWRWHRCEDHARY